MNLYRIRFLAEGGGERGYDIPSYSIYLVKFKYNGKKYSSTVKANSMDTTEARAKGIAKALRASNDYTESAIAPTIADVTAHPNRYHLTVLRLRDL